MLPILIFMSCVPCQIVIHVLSLTHTSCSSLIIAIHDSIMNRKSTTKTVTMVLILRCSTEHLPTSRSSMIHMFSTTLPVCLTETTNPLTTTRKQQLNASPTIASLVSRNPCMIRRFLNTQTKESFSLLENLEQPLYMITIMCTVSTASYMGYSITLI